MFAVTAEGKVYVRYGNMWSRLDHIASVVNDAPARAPGFASGGWLVSIPMNRQKTSLLRSATLLRWFRLQRPFSFQLGNPGGSPHVVLIAR